MRLFSFILAISLAYLAYRFAPDARVDHAFTTAIAGVSATLLGFLIAALSILTAVLNRRLIINLRKTGHYDNLIHDLIHASLMFLVSLVFALMSMFVPDKFTTYAISLQVGIFSYAVATFLLAGKKFVMVIRVLE